MYMYMYMYMCIYTIHPCMCIYMYVYVHIWSYFFLPSSPRLHLSLPLISRGIALHSTAESSRLLAAMATEEGDSGKILEGAQALARAVAQLLRAIRPGEKVGHWPMGAVCLKFNTLPSPPSLPPSIPLSLPSPSLSPSPLPSFLSFFLRWWERC